MQGRKCGAVATPQEGFKKMKKAYYKVYFHATETLQNGNERTRLHAVYIPRFDEITGRHITPAQQIERGTEALKNANFYNIKYGSTVATELIFG